MSSIADRIKVIIDSKNMTITAFASSIGVAQGTLSNIFKRGSVPRSDMLTEILLTYPDVNAHWLLTGQGEMFLSTGAENPNTEIEELKEQIKKLWAAIEADK